MSLVSHVIFWGLLVIVLLLVVTHPSGFATAVSSVGGFALDETAVLSGGHAGTSTAPQGGTGGLQYGFHAA